VSVLEGFALLWSDEATVDGRPERFAPYAFREPIAGSLVIAHDGRPGGALAHTGGALKVDQTDVGLRFSAELDLSDPYARRTLVAIRAGALTGCSFGFHPLEQTEDEDGVLVRRARLAEVTITSNGVYRGGAVWAADAEYLSPRLEALRAQWHNSTTNRRPARIDHERAAFRANVRASLCG
jgi:HK97 family phage prohead protease